MRWCGRNLAAESAAVYDGVEARSIQTAARMFVRNAELKNDDVRVILRAITRQRDELIAVFAAVFRNEGFVQLGRNTEMRHESFVFK